MRAIIATVLLSSIALVGAVAGQRPDFAHGAKLHNVNCTACHGNMTGGDGSLLYTRSQRRVNSMKELKTRVHRCAAGLGLSWSSEDFTDVVHYLSERYYHFGK
jgi:mono/diheme cytochrome c family protein